MNSYKKTHESSSMLSRTHRGNTGNAPSSRRTTFHSNSQRDNHQPARACLDTPRRTNQRPSPSDHSDSPVGFTPPPPTHDNLLATLDLCGGLG